MEEFPLAYSSAQARYSRALATVSNQDPDSDCVIRGRLTSGDRPRRSAQRRCEAPQIRVEDMWPSSCPSRARHPRSVGQPGVLVFVVAWSGSMLYQAGSDEVLVLVCLRLDAGRSAVALPALSCHVATLGRQHVRRAMAMAMARPAGTACHGVGVDALWVSWGCGAVAKGVWRLGGLEFDRLSVP